MTTRYSAVCQYKGERTWDVVVPGITSGVEAERLDQVPDLVAQMVLLAKGTEISPKDVDVIPMLPPDTESITANARGTRRKALEAQWESRQADFAAVTHLKQELKLTQREMGIVLALSHQRVAQIAALVDA